MTHHKNYNGKLRVKLVERFEKTAVNCLAMTCFSRIEIMVTMNSGASPCKLEQLQAPFTPGAPYL